MNRRFHGLYRRGRLRSVTVLTLAVALAVSFFNAVLLAEDGGRLSYTTVISDLINELPYLDTHSVAGQFSSRDRAGGNRDWSDEKDGRRGFLYRDDRGDYVLGEVRGAGELNRLWFASIDSLGTIKIYLDDEDTPAMTLPARQLFSGTNEPFVAPWTFDDELSSGGFVSYAILPFKHYFKMTSTGEPSYYHVGYRKTTGERLDARTVATGEPTTLSGELVVAPGASVDVARLSGPATISKLSLTFPDVLAKPAVRGSGVITDHGRAFTGHSEFRVAIDPENDGVRLVRRLDYSIADQAARVYVDGELVGEWHSPGKGSGFNWRDETFDIPSTLTWGKKTIDVRVEFLSSQIDWNEFYYWVYTKPWPGPDSQSTPADHPHGGGLNLTDTIDVGDAASERAHDYRVVGLKWTGTRDWEYPPPTDPDADRLAASEDILNELWLTASWDQDERQQPQASVAAPVGLFFATPIGPHTIDGHLLQVEQTPDGGTLTSTFPMPFGRSGDVALHNVGDEAVRVAFTIELTESPQVLADLQAGRIGYFNATYRSEMPTRLGHDYTILDASGSGKVVGVSMHLAGPSSRGYLEGDERIRVDGRNTPDIYGTGTEDHFGGAWYFNRGPFQLPLYGAPGHTVRNGQDVTSLYRFFITDPIPFRAGIQYTMEHGGQNELVTDYESVVYWYGVSQPSLVRSDRVMPALSTEAEAHDWAIEGATRRDLVQSSYEGTLEGQMATFLVSYHEGPVSFVMDVEPDNRGVVLRRFLDQGGSKQLAAVKVNGQSAGLWLHPEQNEHHRFADSDFYIPPAITQGENRLEIEITPIGEWNAFSYEAYSIVDVDATAPGSHDAHTATNLKINVEGAKPSLTWELVDGSGKPVRDSERADYTFKVYRSTSPDFVAQPWHAVAETSELGWTEPATLEAGSYYYQVQAIDPTGRATIATDAAEAWVKRVSVFEAEDLDGVVVWRGQFERQKMDWVSSDWSGDHHLFFRADGVGSFIEGSFELAEAGAYEVFVNVTQAPDYGLAQTFIDGEPIGGPVDGYSSSVERSGRIRLGTVELSEGRHKIRWEIVGQGSSSRGYFFGVDVIELVEVTK